jgi:hypothetical protein
LGKLLVWFVPIAMMWAGGQGVYEAVTNRAPQSISCEAANNTPPSAAWLNLTGCRISVIEAAYETRSSGEPSGDIYLPLTSAGDGKSRPVHFVLATRDDAVVSVVKELSALDAKNQGAFFEYLGKNAKRMIYDKDVRGMVQSGINKNDKIQARLRDLNKNLAADFVVIEEGKEPSLTWSALLLAGGIGFLLFLGSRISKTRATGSGGV